MGPIPRVRSREDDPKGDPKRKENVIGGNDELVDALAGFSLFADLSRPALEALTHTFEEEWFASGQRIIRQGFRGTGFHVILQGEAAVTIDGRERARLSKGDFFGELSVLLEEPPVADVVALSELKCVTLAGSQLEEWLLAHPQVMLRMLQSELRRLRSSNRWQS